MTHRDGVRLLENVSNGAMIHLFLYHHHHLFIIFIIITVIITVIIIIVVVLVTVIVSFIITVGFTAFIVTLFVLYNMSHNIKTPLSHCVVITIVVVIIITIIIITSPPIKYSRGWWLFSIECKYLPLSMTYCLSDICYFENELMLLLIGLQFIRILIIIIKLIIIIIIIINNCNYYSWQQPSELLFEETGRSLHLTNYN